MPPTLHITPQEVDTAEKRSQYTVGVVGCGHKGIFYANAFADAGFKVICTDANASVVKKLTKGKTSCAMPQAETILKSHINAEKIDTVSELRKAVEQCDIIVIAITAKIDEQKKNDDNGLECTCKQIGAVLRHGTVVIYGGVASFGFIERTVKEVLENTSGLKVGQDWGLAYNPILNTDTPMNNLELTVAANDQTSLQATATILKTITQHIKQVRDIKTAEAATLFSIAKHDAEVALANELAVFCEDAGIDYFRVLDIQNLNTSAVRPSAIGEANTDEAYFLLEYAENLNTKLRLPALARQINEDMTKQAVNLVSEALKGCGKVLKRGRIAVLGSASPAMDVFVKLLEQKGAKVALYNPITKKDVLGAGIIKTSLNEAVEGADCLVILSGQEQNRVNFKKIKSLMKAPAILMDLAGRFEPETVKTEGFLYFGLGRGMMYDD